MKPQHESKPRLPHNRPGTRSGRHGTAGWSTGRPDHGAGPRARALIVAVVAWTLAWKALSLWRAARNDSKPWFVALLITNTLGILDAIYLFGVDGARRRKPVAEESLMRRGV